MEIMEWYVASCFIGCCNFPSAVGFSNCIAYITGLMTTVTLKKVGLITDVQCVPKYHSFWETYSS